MTKQSDKKTQLLIMFVNLFPFRNWKKRVKVVVRSSRCVKVVLWTRTISRRSHIGATLTERPGAVAVTAPTTPKAYRRTEEGPPTARRITCNNIRRTSWLPITRSSPHSHLLIKPKWWALTFSLQFHHNSQFIRGITKYPNQERRDRLGQTARRLVSSSQTL